MKGMIAPSAAKTMWNMTAIAKVLRAAKKVSKNEPKRNLSVRASVPQSRRTSRGSRPLTLLHRYPAAIRRLVVERDHALVSPRGLAEDDLTFRQHLDPETTLRCQLHKVGVDIFVRGTLLLHGHLVRGRLRADGVRQPHLLVPQKAVGAGVVHPLGAGDPDHHGAVPALGGLHTNLPLDQLLPAAGQERSEDAEQRRDPRKLRPAVT